MNDRSAAVVKEELMCRLAANSVEWDRALEDGNDKVALICQGRSDALNGFYEWLVG